MLNINHIDHSYPIIQKMIVYFIINGGIAIALSSMNMYIHKPTTETETENEIGEIVSLITFSLSIWTCFVLVLKQVYLHLWE